jgi:putative N6-adenine-specific DNA methylase
MAPPTRYSPHAKRIKRHLIGKSHSFFVVTPPGLLQLCHQELSSLPISGDKRASPKEGIQFCGYVHECYLANLHLRTASRILMRISTFKATNFRQLQNKITAVAWELYLPPELSLECKVAVKGCRLYHTQAISTRCKAVIGKRLQIAYADNDKALNHGPSPTVYVRGVDDRFTLSIDSSGENLYKRGLKAFSAQAPLRETIAAALLKWAGYTGAEPMIDPMCGSGTIALEAALISRRIPPGWYRRFAFMDWPCFRPQRWSYLKKEARQLITPSTEALIFASDKNQKQIETLRSTIFQHSFKETIRYAAIDFFELQPEKLTSKKGLIIMNPPYGRRIGSKLNSLRLYTDIMHKLQRDFKGWKVVLLLPHQECLGRANFPFDLRHLFHGGLHVYVLIGRIS